MVEKACGVCEAESARVQLHRTLASSDQELRKRTPSLWGGSPGSVLGAACRQILGSLAVAQFTVLSLEDSSFSPVTT